MSKQQDIEILLELVNMTFSVHGSYLNEYNWLVGFLNKVPENSLVRPFANECLTKINSWGAFSIFGNPYFQFRVDMTRESQKRLKCLAADEIENLKKDKLLLQEDLRKINDRLLRFRLVY